MKNNITPTQRAIELDDNSFIVSKTDLKGRITYCNQVFTAISGFSEPELLGQQHNIIRHPDMPRAVFHLMWQTLQEHHEFVGYIKNMCRNGDHYWVMAVVSAVNNDRGMPVGYSSIRRRPTDEALAVIEPLYQQMLQLEHQAGSRQAIETSSAFLHEQLKKKSYEEFIFSL